MAKVIRKCHLCQKEYEYCPHCSKDPVWMVTFHDTNCKRIFEIVSDYNGKVISPAQAYEMISQCDLSRKVFWSKTMQGYVDAILSYRKVIEPEIVPIVEVEDNNADDAETEQNVETKYMSKKQRKAEKKRAAALQRINSEL